MKFVVTPLALAISFCALASAFSSQVTKKYCDANMHRAVTNAEEVTRQLVPPLVTSITPDIVTNVIEYGGYAKTNWVDNTFVRKTDKIEWDTITNSPDFATKSWTKDFTTNLCVSTFRNDAGYVTESITNDIRADRITTTIGSVQHLTNITIFANRDIAYTAKDISYISHSAPEFSIVGGTGLITNTNKRIVVEDESFESPVGGIVFDGPDVVYSVNGSPKTIGILFYCDGVATEAAKGWYIAYNKFDGPTSTSDLPSYKQEFLTFITTGTAGSHYDSFDKTAATRNPIDAYWSKVQYIDGYIPYGDYSQRETVRFTNIHPTQSEGEGHWETNTTYWSSRLAQTNEVINGIVVSNYVHQYAQIYVDQSASNANQAAIHAQNSLQRSLESYQWAQSASGFAQAASLSAQSASTSAQSANTSYQNTLATERRVGTEVQSVINNTVGAIAQQTAMFSIWPYCVYNMLNDGSNHTNKYWWTNWGDGSAHYPTKYSFNVTINNLKEIDSRPGTTSYSLTTNTSFKGFGTIENSRYPIVDNITASWVYEPDPMWYYTNNITFFISNGVWTVREYLKFRRGSRYYDKELYRYWKSSYHEYPSGWATVPTFSAGPWTWIKASPYEPTETDNMQITSIVVNSIANTNTHTFVASEIYK